MKMPEPDLPENLTPVFMESAQQLARALAEDVAAALAEALAERERALLVVSGGSTPGPFFDALSRLALAWQNVDVLPADERWAPPDSEVRNDRLIRNRLLTGNAAGARLIPLISDRHPQPEASCQDRNGVIQALAWPADVVVLGMGNDGHTASLFPDAPETGEALADGQTPAVRLMHPVSQPLSRITLNRAALGGASFTALHLRGEDKLKTLKRALASPDDWSGMPVRAFLTLPLRIYWSP